MTTLAFNTAVNSINRRIERVDHEVQGRRTSLAVRLHGWIFKWVSDLCTRRVDRFSEELANTFMEFTTLRREIAALENAVTPIDPDNELDAILDRMKATLGRIYARTGEVTESPEQFESLRNALLRLQKVALETRSAVIALQWEIGEHDAPLLGRIDAAAASSKAELDELLDRITSA